MLIQGRHIYAADLSQGFEAVEKPTGMAGCMLGHASMTDPNHAFVSPRLHAAERIKDVWCAEEMVLVCKLLTAPARHAFMASKSSPVRTRDTACQE